MKDLGGRPLCAALLAMAVSAALAGCTAAAPQGGNLAAAQPPGWVDAALLPGGSADNGLVSNAGNGGN